MYENNDEIKIIIHRQSGAAARVYPACWRPLPARYFARRQAYTTLSIMWHTHGTGYSDQQKGTIVTLVDRTHLFEAY